MKFRKIEHYIAQRLVFIIVTLLVIGIIVAIYSLKLVKESGNDPWVSEGSVLAIGIGIITLLGLFLTAISIRKALYTRIYSFGDAVDRICELIQNAKSEGQWAKMICYSPAIGALSAPEESARLISTLEKGPSDFLKIICLGGHKHWNLWESYIKFHTRNSVDESRGKSTALIEKLKENGADIIEKKNDLLPHFHIIFSNNKGIIFSPLSHYPFYFSPYYSSSNKVDTKKQKLSDPEVVVKEVSVVGYETEDKAMISRFDALYTFCKNELK